MNTIIIHPNNRVSRTPEHDLSAALIAPVSRWYRKPTPWWVDKFEEVGLHPIVEADEIADVLEERDESLDEIAIEDKQVDLACEANTCENAELARTDILFEDSQDIVCEHNDDEPEIFKDIALDDITFDNDLHGINKDGSDFFEDVILVDEVDNDDEDDDDDTVMDVTFTGQQATLIFCAPARIVEDYEWELDLEDEGDDDVFRWDYASRDINEIFQ